ncbi:MAG TPA: hypothetical protein VGK41_05605 [Solirubrobacterales bacterium]
MSEQGKINGWSCPICRETTYAVHVDDGVTPFMLGCKTKSCEGMGRSMFYPDGPPPQHVLVAVSWEWYSPDDRERRKLDAAVLEHVEKGGLLVRELTDAGRDVLRDVHGFDPRLN